MFPNLRLMIVAVLASIMGIGCALGLFAEFRVSRDSFVRESNADAPLQLGSNDLAPAALVNGPATFGFRFQANALSFASDRADGMVPSIGDASVEANSAPAAELTTPAVPAINTAEPSPTPDRGSTTTPANPAGNVTPAETGTVGNRDIQQDTRESAPANIAVHTPAASAPPDETAPKSEIAPASPSAHEPKLSEPLLPAAAKGSAKTPAARRRLTTVRHFQRQRPAAPSQPSFAAGLPFYQWTSPVGLQTPQPARRRVIVRRVRPAKKTVGADTASQTTANTTLGSTTP